MKIACFKKVSSLALASAMALGAASYAPSAAAKCAVVNGKTWGCGTANVLRHAYRLPYPPYSVTRDWIWGGSLDKLTDGWAVWQRLRMVGEKWTQAGIIPKSTDNNATWNYYYQYVDRPLTAGIRLYRADGRYLTLLWGS